MRIGTRLEVIYGYQNGSGLLGRRAVVTEVRKDRFNIKWTSHEGTMSTIGWRFDEVDKYFRIINKPTIILLED